MVPVPVNICMYIYIYIYIYNVVLGEPLPCNPEAETALQPLLWHSEGLHFQVYYSMEESFFTDTGVERAALQEAAVAHSQGRAAAALGHHTAIFVLEIFVPQVPGSRFRTKTSQNRS